MTTAPQIYISGPISGYHRLNRAAFDDAASVLSFAGYSPVNPFLLVPTCEGEPDWEDYMRADLKALLDCDGVATLPNWQESRGARIEVDLAHSLRVPVMPLSHWLGRTGE